MAAARRARTAAGLLALACRAIKDYWSKVDSDLGTRIARRLGLLTMAR